jgi:hypothetical protein
MMGVTAPTAAFVTRIQHDSQPASAAASPSSSSLLTFNSTVGARPLLLSSSPRLPLSSVVSSLVNCWSLAFLDLARSGDPPSMLLVAQMYLVDRGYGKIRPDRAEGVRWLMRCVELDEGEAREMAKRICPQEWKEWVDNRKRKGEQERLKEEEEKGRERKEADCAPSERRMMAAGGVVTS